MDKSSTDYDLYGRHEWRWEGGLNNTPNTAQAFQSAQKEFRSKRPHEVGSMQHRSGLRSRLGVDGLFEVEMDWALFSVDKWPIRIDLNVEQISRGLYYSGVVPGARIQATGRTSGCQKGVINTAQSLINHGMRMTLEWSIIPEPGSSINEWVLGDIKEITGAKSVCLPGNGEVLDVERGEGKWREVCLEEVLDVGKEEKGKGKEISFPIAPISSQLPHVDKTAISNQVENSPVKQQISAG
ncbi:hypothetical protein BKA65DRAFT_475586 [Rhexocercosporidium sp. MPI-PUGE-AT-0058]|nr:hypothetical protein BKA65DRAFT_475586 [Rhexocercosporidium sp. MPI-PUGE-AT-0058]